MAREFSRARIGLFVLLSAVALIGGVIWLGSQQILAQWDRYVTYYQGSVSGLEIGASVKFRGVSVGRVADILIDPQDSSQVLIKMDLRPGTPVKKDMYAELRMTGITGIKYVELTGGDKDAELLPPGTEKNPAVIPCRQTLFEKVDEQFEELYTRLSGVIENLRALTDEDSREQFRATLEGFSELSQSLARTLEALQPGISRMEPLGQETRNLIVATREEIQNLGAVARSSLEEVSGVVSDSPLPQTLERLDGVSRNLEQFTERLNRQLDGVNVPALAGELRGAIGDIRHAAQSLDQLINRLEQNPSALVFGQPRAERQPAKSRRGR
jgi:phospholipid/cholesterol/gamma-HCH transport system substrate-binding protein